MWPERVSACPTPHCSPIYYHVGSFSGRHTLLLQAPESFCTLFPTWTASPKPPRLPSFPQGGGPGAQVPGHVSHLAPLPHKPWLFTSKTDKSTKSGGPREWPVHSKSPGPGTELGTKQGLSNCLLNGTQFCYLQERICLNFFIPVTWTPYFLHCPGNDLLANL